MSFVGTGTGGQGQGGRGPGGRGGRGLGGREDNHRKIRQTLDLCIWP